MSGANGRQPAAYRVSAAGPAGDQLLAIITEATARGADAAVLAAIRRVRSRLRGDPRRYGEPRYTLREMRLQVFSMVVPPLYVEYGVHEEQPVVFIRRVVYIPAPPG